MGRYMTLVLLLCAGQGVVLGQQVDFVEQVPLDLNDLEWNYVGPRTAQPDGVLYQEDTSSGFFGPLSGQRSIADDIHFDSPVSISGFTVAWVSRTSQGNVPITMTVSFLENNPHDNFSSFLYQTPTINSFGSVTVTGLETGFFLTSVALAEPILTSPDIWMHVQFSTNIGQDTGQLIAADIDPTVGNPSHDLWLTFDPLFGTYICLHIFHLPCFGYTPGLPTTDPDRRLPGNLVLTVTGRNMEPNVTVVIKGTAPCSPFNRESHGVLPVSVLNTSSLSGATIYRADGVGGRAKANHGPPGPHTTQSGDDLNLFFNTDRVVSVLELGSLADGDQLELCVTGIMQDNPTPFLGCDCVEIVPPGNAGPNMLTVNSNLPGAWVAMSPPDEQADTGGYGSFQRTYPLSTSVTLTAEEFYQGQRFVGWKFNGEFLSRDVSTVVTVAGSNANGKTVDAVFRRSGDITGDESINLNDFAMFAVCFGQTWGSNLSGNCSNEALASSDLDRNGVIDLRDFAIFAVHFGT